jgi:hypothetical protein
MRRRRSWGRLSTIVHAAATAATVADAVEVAADAGGADALSLALVAVSTGAGAAAVHLCVFSRFSARASFYLLLPRRARGRRLRGDLPVVIAAVALPSLAFVPPGLVEQPPLAAVFTGGLLCLCVCHSGSSFFTTFG